MALPLQIASVSYGSLSKMLPRNKTSSFVANISKSFNVPSPTIQCKAPLNVSHQSHEVSRRSGNFKPDVWHHDYIQSLNSKYMEQAYEEESRKLREKVRILVSETVNPLDQLELIDTLQRLGVDYHFKSEIKKILDNVCNGDKLKSEKNSHVTALEFRLLRQHGYDISTDVFDGFQDEKGNFQASLPEDIKGMLSLYEASFHIMEGETILEKAKDFTSKSLEDFVNKNPGHQLTSQVKHALEIPLHWRLPRWEARWFIHEYQTMPHMNPILLQLAKLDFNKLQAIYQQELKSNIRWWERTGLEKKAKFYRCRVVDNYVWGLGMNSEPQYGNVRRVIGNLCALMTLTDDMYDVHGTLDELELFTEAIMRWDPNDIDSLPDYMKVVFSAIHNFVDETTAYIQKEKGLNIHSYLKKAWQDYCKAFMVEARWYHGGKTPRLKDYLENGLVSIGGPIAHLHAYLFMPNPIRKEDLDSLEQNPNLFYLSGLNFRLLDDFGSYKRELETGDVPSAIQCHMNDVGVSEEEAIKHIKSLIYSTWQRMNQEVAKSSFSRDFSNTTVELSRTATFFYHYGEDTYTLQDSMFKNHVNSLLFEPIPITCMEN